MIKRLLVIVRSNSAQASLEALMVFSAWFLMIILYLNIIFLLASLMMIQSMVNRTALAAAASGCLSDDLKNAQEGNIALGAKDVTIYGATDQMKKGSIPDDKPWTPARRSLYISEDSKLPIYGRLKMRNISCSTNAQVEYGHVIYIAASYEQDFLIFGRKRIVRSATLISQQRQGVL